MARRFGVLLGALVLILGAAVSVRADASNPDVINVQVNGLTVTLSGTWSWPSRTGLGCDAATDRFVGWAADWGDPAAPGNDVPGRTASDPHWSVGTPTDNAVHTNFDCGSIGPANYPIGTWGPISHTYSGPGDYTVCVLMYDIHRTGRDHHIVLTGNHGLIAGGPDRNRDNSAETNGLTPTGAAAGPCIAATFHVSSIHIEKTALQPSLPAGGGPETYNYTVTNLGQAPLSNVVVADDKCASVTFVGGDTNGDSKLDPTETWSYTCSTTLAATTTNTATVNAVDETTEPPTPVSDSAQATVDVAAATPIPPTQVPATASPAPPTSVPTSAPTPFQSFLGATGSPRTTLPPTDAVAGGGRSDLGGVLLAIGAMTLISSLLAPASLLTRRRSRR